MPTPPIEGTYVLVKSENFDEYLKSCGINYFLRCIANKFKPTLEITKDGEFWVWRTETPLKTIVIRFKVNEEFETDFPDGSGRKLVAMPEIEGNKVTLTQRLDGTTIVDVKEFTEDEMITTITKGDVTCVRIYRRL